MTTVDDMTHRDALARSQRKGVDNGLAIAARWTADLGAVLSQVQSTIGGTWGIEWGNLLKQTGMTPNRLQGCLLYLEAEGLIRRSAVPGHGTYYSRKVN
jgi:hypothetical protein